MNRINIRQAILILRMHLNLKIVIALLNIHNRTSDILHNRIGELTKILPQLMMLLDESKTKEYFKKEK